MNNRYVNTVTRQSGSSFYFSFFSLPREKREAITAVYAFCRKVDDVVDLPHGQGGLPAGRQAPGDQANPASQIARWREEIERTYQGQPTMPLTQSLAVAIERFSLSRAYFDGILQGVEMDLSHKRYPTFESLEVYCNHVAGEVGLLCVEIFGYRSERLKSYAMKLGTAFQLTNILRDVKTDAEQGRIYIPQEELKKFGVKENWILDKSASPAVFAAGPTNQRHNGPPTTEFGGDELKKFQRLMAFETRRAKDYYRDASVLPTREERPALRAAEMMRAVYENILDRIERRHYNVFEGRIRVPTAMKLWLSAKAWWESRS